MCYFEKFDICFSSSLQSKKYLKHLGAKKIKYIGNLKFSQTEKKEDLLSKNLKKYFLSKKIWCAASTHDTEEKFCFIAHKKLKKKLKSGESITKEMTKTVHDCNGPSWSHSSEVFVTATLEITKK